MSLWLAPKYVGQRLDANLAGDPLVNGVSVLKAHFSPSLTDGVPSSRIELPKGDGHD